MGNAFWRQKYFLQLIRKVSVKYFLQLIIKVSDKYFLQLIKKSIRAPGGKCPLIALTLRSEKSRKVHNFETISGFLIVSKLGISFCQSDFFIQSNKKGTYGDFFIWPSQTALKLHCSSFSLHSYSQLEYQFSNGVTSSPTELPVLQLGVSM